MRLSYLVLLVMSLIVSIKWIIGLSPDVDIDALQNGFEIGIIIVVLIEIIPKFIKKLSPGDVKHFLGMFPTFLVCLVLAWKFPQINPELLEVLMVVLVVVNLLTLRIVKRKIAKRLATHPKKTIELEYEPIKHFTPIEEHSEDC